MKEWKWQLTLILRKRTKYLTIAEFRLGSMIFLSTCFIVLGKKLKNPKQNKKILSRTVTDQLV